MPGEQLVGQLAVGQRQAEPDHVVQLGEAVHHEVAGGVLGAAELVRTVAEELPGAAVRQVGRQRTGRASGQHVEHVVADHERLRGGHAHRRSCVEHAVGGGLGRDPVVARDDHVEVAGVQVAKTREGSPDGRQAVPREDADLESLGAQVPDETLGVLVGLGPGGAGQLKPFQRGQRILALRAGGQRLDPFQKEAVGRTADLTFDGREIEGARTRERAVEIEEHGPQTKRPRAAPGPGLTHPVAPVPRHPFSPPSRRPHWRA